MAQCTTDTVCTWEKNDNGKRKTEHDGLYGSNSEWCIKRMNNKWLLWWNNIKGRRPGINGSGRSSSGGGGSGCCCDASHSTSTKPNFRFNRKTSSDSLGTVIGSTPIMNHSTETIAYQFFECESKFLGE